MARLGYIRKVIVAFALSNGITWGLAKPLMAGDTFFQAPDPAKEDELRPYRSPLEEALIAMKARHYDVACPALHRIVLVDHSPANVFALAQCHDQWGKVATAYKAYADYLDMVDELEPDARSAERVREELALGRHAALEKRVPWVTLYLPLTAPPNTLVTRRPEAGRPPVRVVLEKALPLDPGEHVVYTRVPTGRPYMNRLVMREGERRAVVLQVDLTPSGDAVLAEPIQPMPPVLPPPERPRSAQRIAAIGLGIAGAAGLAFGLTMGGLALGQTGVAAAANCHERTCDSKAKEAEAEEAEARRATYFKVGSVAVPLGVVAMGVGITLYLTEPPQPRLTQTGWQWGVGVFPDNTNVQMRLSW